jgi:ferrous iron transport protein A
MNLDNAPLATAWRVTRVLNDSHNEDRARQLEEIGFLPGEQVSVMTRALPGGDPLVVRVGLSTFALRGAEARCIEVLPAHPHG